MSVFRMFDVLGPDSEPTTLRKAFLPALFYPFWHLAAPASATDPWIAPVPAV